jgi:hypothetical protein
MCSTLTLNTLQTPDLGLLAKLRLTYDFHDDKDIMPRSQSDDLFLLHRIIRFISGQAASSFFTEVRVIGGEHVPAHGPLIV